MLRLLAFDIETAKVLPEHVTNLLAHGPLGIACAVAVAEDRPEPFIWHGRDASGRPTGQMSPAEALRLVAELEAAVADGYRIVTWNGLGFDFAVLAEESGARARCARLALAHCDLMFQAVCTLGYYIGLEKAAEGMRLAGKLSGHRGAEAPALWAAGKCDEVLAYCTQDVRVTLELAHAGAKRKHLAWVTRRGEVHQMPLPDGWLSVAEARALPLPDTSWMSDPPAREDDFAWFPKA